MAIVSSLPQRLDAALHLARLAGLRAEAVDERMQARHLALLARGHRRRLLDAGGVLALEIGVIAGPVRELAVLEIHDAVHDVVEELAIVRDQQQRAREIAAASARATAPRRDRGG